MKESIDIDGSFTIHSQNSEILQNSMKLLVHKKPFMFNRWQFKNDRYFFIKII